MGNGAGVVVGIRQSDHGKRRARTDLHIERVYRRAAPRYDRGIRVVSKLLGFDAARMWACSEAHGNVLEIGIGTGLNLPLYPSDAHITAVDVSSEMLELARQRAAGLDRRVELHHADGARLPFADSAFDVVVATLVLCTTPDPVATVAEAWRVCRPDGELRFFDHGLSRSRIVRRLERALEPLAVRLQADRLTLDPASGFRAAGVPIHEVIRTRAGVCWQIQARRTPSP
jgi:ubiquinone/menaquinone biosynthesis C-methylase UbiE